MFMNQSNIIFLFQESFVDMIHGRTPFTLYDALQLGYGMGKGAICFLISIFRVFCPFCCCHMKAVVTTCQHMSVHAYNEHCS